MLITNCFIYKKQICHLLPNFGEYIQGDSRPRPVILDTPVIPAIGWDDWGVGNPEEQRRITLIFPLHINGGRSVGCAFVNGAPRQD